MNVCFSHFAEIKINKMMKVLVGSFPECLVWCGVGTVLPWGGSGGLSVPSRRGIKQGQLRVVSGSETSSFVG